MKKIAILIFLAICLSSISIVSFACSPISYPLMHWIKQYNEKDYLVVLGYHEIKNDKVYFFVTRSSNNAVKAGQSYQLYDYGPYGSVCEEYEMPATFYQAEMGKEHSKLLLVYTQYSIDGKIVTPFDLTAGVNAQNNKIIYVSKDWNAAKLRYYESTISLNDFWNKILEGDVKNFEWTVTETHWER